MVALRGDVAALMIDCAVDIGMESWYNKNAEVAGFWYIA